MAKSKCKWCGERKETSEGVKVPAGFFCDMQHCFEFANANKEKQRKKIKSKKLADLEKKKKSERKRSNQRKKELMTRAEWYAKLQSLVNQYITKVRDKNAPCCTCGTINPNIKYDAGHFIPQKGYDPRRFELTNIHKQCSVQCNQYGSGKRAEYREFIETKYGSDHLEWLESECNHKELKEQFPHWSDIEKEIIRYRKLLRENGVKPVV